VRALKRLLSLKHFVAIVATMTVLVFAATTPSVAVAAGGHGGFGGHGDFGGHPGSVGHPGHSGFGHHPGFFRGAGGVIVVPGYGYWPDYPDVAAPPGYWYYCPSAGAYYPDVGACPEPWMQVPPS
jgi:hypothetical protein